MQMFLQFGHGMMGHTRELLGCWGGGAVVLSPRDLTGQQLQRMAQDVTRIGGEALLDPQCFSTDADHYRLVTHSYREPIIENPDEVFLGGPLTANLLAGVAELGRTLGVRRHILPCLLADVVTEDWFASVETIIEEASNHFADAPTLLTLALSSQAMLDELQVEAVLERARGWGGIAGFYVIAETPTPYLVDHPVWLANLLNLVAGLKLLEKSVLVGYCNQQMLCLGAANIDAMAAGTWLNVRAFPPSKFFSPAGEEVSRRATWYYCPHALSEYKLPFLDIALGRGVLDRMRSALDLGSAYADALFRGVPPTSVNWGEQDAFRHYLTCLHSQALSVPVDSFQSAYDHNRRLLDEARQVLAFLRQEGVFGHDREFTPILDVNESALIQLTHARGSQLRRQWHP